MKSQGIKILKEELSTLEQKMNDFDKKFNSQYSHLAVSQFLSASNLIHYLTLRAMDIRTLQDQLHICGLSSLASSESHILRQLQAIQQRLGKKYKDKDLALCSYEYSRHLLQLRSQHLFGEKKDPLTPYIMVTMDASYADDFKYIKSLLLNGMHCARINCAHDEPETWAHMINQLKKAMRSTGMNCKIYMDLAGPKIRTKLLAKGAEKGKVKIEEGECIWLDYDASGYSKNEKVISPDEPGILSMLKKGERVYFDDGMIKGDIESIQDGKISVRITRISSIKKLIKQDKGINFPDSEILIDSLTPYDLSCLPFICKHADMVGYSFVRTAEDLRTLQAELKKIKLNPPPIILKIETPEAVKNLPSLLVQGMHDESYGVMIARGDLAIEIGFERMSEIQEEILWICEAAHVPVIWATQVLENLNKTGIASRAEITDASMATRAECIMINKGHFTLKVIDTLHDINRRMEGHHIKKRNTFRPLNIALNFLNEHAG